MEPLTMGLMAAGMAPSIFGGGKVKVPGSMAKPTDPSKNILGEDSFVKGPFSLSDQADQNQDQAQGLLGNLKNFATQQGPSSIAQNLLQANDQQTQMQRDDLSNQMSSQRATQEANMAMKGGLGTGSRERMASQGMLGNMQANQQLNAQSSLNNMNTLAQDEDRKFGLLQGLPSQFLQMGQYDQGKKQFDINNSIGTATNSYNQQMGAYAGNQLARQQGQAFNAGNEGLLKKVTGGLF